MPGSIAADVPRCLDLVRQQLTIRRQLTENGVEEWQIFPGAGKILIGAEYRDGQAIDVIADAE